MAVQLIEGRLQEEIDKSRAIIRTDGYSMSIGEWISLYERAEIDIHPEFQRFFRWSPKQKSRLIESILLGIPIPQIFVAQREDGVWDVVDGLQRLSTIYQFAGILRDEENHPIPPLVLEQTKYLPSLQGKKWDDAEDPENSLTTSQRLIIKRSKIDVSIILRESDEASKYELFQRLNTGGSPLSEQEVRNSILVMINRDMYRWMRRLAENPDFVECVALTDRALDEQYDMELVLRFLVFRTLDERELSRIGDLGDYLTDKLSDMARNKEFDFKEEELAFSTAFGLLRKTTGSDSFKKFDSEKGKFMGGFLVSGYEVVAIGVGYNYKVVSDANLEIEPLIRGVWQKEQFTSKSGSGIRASSRVPNTIPLGRKLFKP
jgi:Protein of unknown function DUF262